jgi:hypothetical protein
LVVDRDLLFVRLLERSSGSVISPCFRRFFGCLVRALEKIIVR